MHGLTAEASSLPTTHARAGAVTCVPALSAALSAADDGRGWVEGVAGREAHTRGAATALNVRCGERVPVTSRSIFAQVPPMPRSNRAQSSTARVHGHTTVSVCMLRIIEAHMEVHRVHGSLIHDPALLQAVALGYERFDTLLALCAAGWSHARLSAARKRQARTVGRTPAVHCTVCRAVCTRVFHRAHATSACLNLHPHACLRHGVRQQ